MLECTCIRPKQVIGRLCTLHETVHHRMGSIGRNLGHRVEAQIQGEIRLDRDVNALFANGLFQYLKTGLLLEKLWVEKVSGPL